ncbi:MAG: transposase family protein [Sulfobacillus sp.]
MYAELAPYIEQPRQSQVEQLNGRTTAGQLSGKNRLLLTLVWLRYYPPYSLLEAIFGINKFYISRDIHHLIYIIHWRFQHEVYWPSEEHQVALEGTFPDVDPKTIFSMDFTVQPISEPRKGVEHHYYRGDKGKHFFNTFGAVDYAGIFLNAQGGYAGHANDQRSWTLTPIGSGALQLGLGRTGTVSYLLT